MFISIVIVTWNNEKEIEACLSSTISSVKHLPSYSITVIDNSSLDDTVKIINNKFPTVHLLKQDKNLGYARGVNIGIEAQQAENYLILNPDTKINKVAIDSMLASLLDNENVGVAATEQWDEDRMIRHTVSHANILLFPLLWIERFLTLISLSKRHKFLFRGAFTVPMLNGGCFIVKREVFDKVGLLCNELFIYGEEEEFFQRVRKGGWKMKLIRSSVIYHYRERSIKKTRKKWSYYLDSRIRLLKYKLRSLQGERSVS